MTNRAMQVAAIFLAMFPDVPLRVLNRLADTLDTYAKDRAEILLKALEEIAIGGYDEACKRKAHLAIRDWNDFLV